MKYRGVIFDLDGTLLDTLNDIGTSMNLVLSRHGFPAHPLEAYKQFIAGGGGSLIKRTLPPEHLCEETIAQYTREYREEYSGNLSKTTKPYDGIIELLEKLEKMGIRKSVLSNKPDHYTKLLVGEFLGGFHFDIVLGSREGIPNKPDPQTALEIAGETRIAPEEYILLGDTEYDIKAAKAAGMFGVGAGWGFRGTAELYSYGAQTVIEHPLELCQLLGINIPS